MNRDEASLDAQAGPDFRAGRSIGYRKWRNEMHASSLGSEHRDGVIRVVPEADGIVAVCLEGDFDLANAAALSKEVDRALENGNNLILDLSHASFIDSSVVHVLVRAAKAVNGSQRAVVLQLGTAAVVERVLGIVGIERVLPRAHDRQEAVRITQEKVETVYRAARNQSMFRVVNEQMRELNEAFATLTDTYTIACECYDTGCITTIQIRAEEYLRVRAEPRRFVVRPGHLLTDLEHVVEESDAYVVVEKTDTAGDVAKLLDRTQSPAIANRRSE
jgi:anti-anti-sigma factor